MLQVLIMTLYCLAGLTGLGFVAGLMVWAFDGTVNIMAMGAMAVMTLVWFAAGAVFHRSLSRSKQPSVGVSDHKAKRDGSDMYSIIDRLVYELTPDERSYLQRRLDETLQDNVNAEADLGTTLESLLSDREERHLSS